jgi:hypothetical protein
MLRSAARHDRPALTNGYRSQFTKECAALMPPPKDGEI